MKKIAILTVVLIMTGFITYAQNPKVVSAYNYLGKGKLDKAKEAIDAATVHEQTMNDAKTWLYRGNIYLAIFVSGLPVDQFLKPLPLDTNIIKKLDTNSLKQAIQAYLKCLDLDKKSAYKEEAINGVNICANQYFDIAATFYNAGNYIKAINNFETCIGNKNKINQFDALGMYYSAKSYDAIAIKDTANKSLNKFEKSKNYYKELIDKKFSDTTLAPQAYIGLAEINMYQKDTLKAITIVQDGRKIFKNNFNLMIEEANIYLATNNIIEADKIINLAFKKDPNNPNLRYYVGTNYFNMLEKMQFEKDSNNFKNTFNQAESNLIKAIELEPKLYDAIYNLAVLYLNEGARIYNAAQKLDPSKQNELEKYDIENAKSQVFLLKSIAQFEKYYNAFPDDNIVMTNLKVLYIKTKQTDSPKYKEIVDKLQKK